MNCDDCNYKKDLVQCVESMKVAVTQMDQIVSENEALKRERILQNYQTLCLKKKLEHQIQELAPMTQNPDVECSDAAFYQKLKEVSVRAKQEMQEKISKTKEEAAKKYQGKKVLFVLPLGNACGGGNVVMTEALAMRHFGVDAQIVNIAVCKPLFDAAYKEFDVPVRYVEEWSQLLEFAGEYDAVIATACFTVECANFMEIAKRTKVGYYVQDYEPYFYDRGTEEYAIAERSYSIVPEIRCVTKTKWNQNEVKKETGVDCTLVGPSMDIYGFEVGGQAPEDGKIRISAMIRPNTPRRAAGQTMQVLSRIYWKYRDKVQIHIFGSNEQIDSEFFINANTNFEYIDHGEISPENVAELMKHTDIFVDFSVFQAMGLTAMEAMASGCAVIVPSAGGAGSFAEHEKNALIVDETSEDACFLALERLVRDRELRERLTEQSVVDICQYYPEQSAYKVLEAILQ